MTELYFLADLAKKEHHTQWHSPEREQIIEYITKQVEESIIPVLRSLPTNETLPPSRTFPQQTSLTAGKLLFGSYYLRLTEASTRVDKTFLVGLPLSDLRVFDSIVKALMREHVEPG